jgi:hypothetical protein
VDENYVYTPFWDSENNRIKNFFAVPSFSEILDIDLCLPMFQGLNQSSLYKFDIFGPIADVDSLQKPSLWYNDHIHLIKAKLPKLTRLDIKESDNQMKERLRLVDFKEAYNLKGNLVLKYLSYFRNFQNLFDLEFFLTKLPSKSRSIAGLEQNVNSGLPFWEDGDEMLFDGVEDDYLENKEIAKPEYSR